MKFVVYRFLDKDCYIQDPVKPEQWVDRNTSLVRLICKDGIDPFGQKVLVNAGFEYNKTDKSKYIARLRLTIYPFNAIQHSEVARTKLIREVEKQKFPCSNQPTLHFSAFPSSKNGREPSDNYWVMYSFLDV